MPIYLVHDLLILASEPPWIKITMPETFDRLGSKRAEKYPDTAGSGDAYDVEEWNGHESEIFASHEL
jgi:hypothetical protein